MNYYSICCDVLETCKDICGASLTTQNRDKLESLNKELCCIVDKVKTVLSCKQKCEEDICNVEKECGLPEAQERLAKINAELKELCGTCC